MHHLIDFFQSIISFPAFLLETGAHSQQPPCDYPPLSCYHHPAGKVSCQLSADTDTILSLMAALTPHPHPEHKAGQMGFLNTFSLPAFQKVGGRELLGIGTLPTAVCADQ